MILMSYGNGVQKKEWEVQESEGPGYSRVYFLQGGEVTYSDGLKERRLDLGKLYLFPSHQSFSITHNPEDPIRCLWCHLNLFPILLTELLEISVPSGGGLSHLLGAFSCGVEETPVSLPYLFDLAHCLTSFLSKEGYLPRPDPTISAFLSYIEAHYTEELAIERISRHFGYAPESFIRLFRQKAHMTPYQYLISYRLNQAALLLQQEESITEIAQKVGYHELKSFERAFKSRFGCSPAHYRKNYHPIA